MARLRHAPSVLLVESSDDDRRMYALYLRFTGFTPIECPTTDAALEQAPEADVIVTGIRVGGSCDGIELIRQLRADPRTRHKPLIVVTACVFDVHRRRAQQAGCDAFLPKPCQPDMLVAAIERVLASRRESSSAKTPRMIERTVTIWTATHHNGWITTASENADGTYSAWAAPIDSTPSVDYLEDGPEHARIAAEYALKRKTGHQCSEQCSGWTYHEHVIPVPDRDGPEERA